MKIFLILNWAVWTSLILLLDLITQVKEGVDAPSRLIVVCLVLVLFYRLIKDLESYDRPTLSYLKMVSKEKIFLYNSLN